MNHVAFQRATQAVLADPPSLVLRPTRAAEALAYATAVRAAAPKPQAATKESSPVSQATRASSSPQVTPSSPTAAPQVIRSPGPAPSGSPTPPPPPKAPVQQHPVAPAPPAPTPTSAPAAAPASAPATKPFLVFYGGYSNTGSAQEAAQVAQQLSGYPVVVFGDAWTFPDFAAKVQADLPTTQFFGYVDTNSVTWQHIQTRLDLLHSMHFQGVLLDEVGSGFSSTTANLQKIVDYAHQDGLRVLVNTWFPDILNNVQLTPGSDGYLCENWVFSDGQWRTPRGADIYAELAALKQRGLLIYMIATMNGPNFTMAQASLPIAKTIQAIGGQYISISGSNYSAQSNAIYPASDVQQMIDAAGQ